MLNMLTQPVCLFGVNGCGSGRSAASDPRCFYCTPSSDQPLFRLLRKQKPAELSPEQKASVLMELSHELRAKQGVGEKAGALSLCDVHLSEQARLLMLSVLASKISSLLEK